jgi:hypothetical protein
VKQRIKLKDLLLPFRLEVLGLRMNYYIFLIEVDEVRDDGEIVDLVDPLFT